MSFQLFQIAIIACIVGFVEGRCSASADVIIAIPSAWSLPHSEFISFENNLIDLMYYLDIHPTRINIGLLRYGESVTVQATPQPFKSREQVNTRITLLTKRNYIDGYWLNLTNAIDAMDRMANEPAKMYPKSILRGNARKIGILFIDGNSTEAQGVLDSTNNAKMKGMLIFTIVAVGSGTYGLTAPQIASGACNFFQVKSFENELRYLIPLLANAICSELDPSMQPKITTNNCAPGQYRKARPNRVTCRRRRNMIQPDPNNCAYFYKCGFYNTRPFRQACPAGTIFDPIATICNYADRVACVSDLQCPTRDNQLYPHPLDCHRYINCDPFGIPHLQSCPPNTMFDTEWQTCNVSSEITCVLPRV